MTARLVLALAAMLVAAAPAWAALSPAELARVKAGPSAGAAVPLDLPLQDSRGQPVTLGAAIAGRPALLLLADYRCTQLCGSLLGIAAQAFEGSGLSPRTEVAFVVAGFNPEAGAGDAAAMGEEELAATPDIAAQARLLTGSPEAIARLERALGFSAVRDPGAQRYAHPADLYVLTADGRVSRVLNGLSVDPGTLRLALVEAGQGRIGSLVDRLHVLCYGLDPLSGASTGLAQTMLRLGATGTLLLAGGGFFVMLRRRGAAGRGS